MKWSGRSPHWRDEHLFVLAQALSMYDSLASDYSSARAKMKALLGPLERPSDRAGRRE